MIIFKERRFEGRWEFGSHTQYDAGDFFIGDDPEAYPSTQTIEELRARDDVYEVDTDYMMDEGL